MEYNPMRGIFIRVIADLLMINFSLAVAFVFRFLMVTINVPVDINLHVLFDTYLLNFAEVFAALSTVCITVFFVCGFYTRGRAYKGKYKVMVILQAVSLGYLIFGFILYLFSRFLDLPRGVLITSWVITLGVLVTSRLWSVIWKKMTDKAAHIDPDILRAREKVVLVIGGAGYIGSALLPKLLNAGYKVRILDLFLYGDEPIKSYIGHKNLSTIRADFRQIDKIVEAVRGVGLVIHLGAIVGDPACALNESLTIEVNLMATRMIAEVCKGYGVQRFIFASTCSVYGEGDEFLDEHSKLNPVSLYAKSKIASEKVLLKMADETFCPVILRFGTVFGNSGRTRFDLVVNLLSAKAWFEKKITVFGADQWRPFIHVDDVAEAMFKVLTAPVFAVKNEIFNVGDNKNNHTIGEVGRFIKNKVPDAELLEVGEDGDRRNYRVDFSKIQKKINFKAKWSLEMGIDQIIDAMRRGEIKEYADPQFSNVKTLRNQMDIQIMSNHIVGIRDMVYGDDSVNDV